MEVAHPAQQDSFSTSWSNVNAASFSISNESSAASLSCVDASDNNAPSPE